MTMLPTPVRFELVENRCARLLDKLEANGFCMKEIAA